VKTGDFSLFAGEFIEHLKYRQEETRPFPVCFEFLNQASAFASKSLAFFRFDGQ
jgi:hypothetical protein